MTIFINIFGGAGTGKSITASLLFSRLKLQGVSTELITEFAKERVWVGDLDSLKCQPFITGTQIYRQYIVNGKVDYAITDAPILLGLVYRGFGCNEDYEKSVVYQFNLFRNINVFLSRDLEQPFEENGRVGSLQEAQTADSEIKKLLFKHSIPYLDVSMSKDGSHIGKILNFAVVHGDLLC